ncbi:hypothetical protein [Niabella terrae]
MFNANENQGLALARGFIVLIMPAVHTVLIYSSDSVKAGWLGSLLGFFAEQPGAQLFMMQMGLFIGIGRPKSFTRVFRRFLLLFLAGYILNFLRLVLPYWWGGLPESFLIHNHIAGDHKASFSLLAVGDILQFAALGYVTTHLILRFFKPLMLKITLLILLLMLSPYLWTFEVPTSIFHYFSGLFVGLPPVAFFPYFPWICYPVFGLIFAQVIKQYHYKIKYLFWGPVALSLILLSLPLMRMEPADWGRNFYRLGPGGTIFHIGVALLWILLFLVFAEIIRWNRFFNFIMQLSDKITPIYLVQWIIIIWLIRVFGFNVLGIGMTIVAIVVNTVLSFSVAMYLPTRLFNVKYRLLQR